jgi:hypothetical protein
VKFAEGVKTFGEDDDDENKSENQEGIEGRQKSGILKTALFQEEKKEEPKKKLKTLTDAQQVTDEEDTEEPFYS